MGINTIGALALSSMLANAQPMDENKMIDELDGKELTEIEAVKGEIQPELDRLRSALKQKGLDLLLKEDGKYYISKLENKPQLVSLDSNTEMTANILGNPNSGFFIGKESDYKKHIDDFKGVPGVKIKNGEIKFFPMQTLNGLRGNDTIYKSSIEKMLNKNPILIKQFQYFLYSSFGLSDIVLTGTVTDKMLTALTSYYKNEQISETFDKVHQSYGPQGLKYYSINGRKFMTLETSKYLGDKDSVAILDIPQFDVDGKVILNSDFTASAFGQKTDYLNTFTKIPSFDGNVVRLILNDWMESVRTHSEEIKYELLPDSTKMDKKRPGLENRTKQLKTTAKPTIIGGSGAVLSGNTSKDSGVNFLISAMNNGGKMGISTKDEIDPANAVNLKTDLGMIYEATNKGSDVRLAAKLTALYAMARAGTTIKVEKGSEMEKFAMAFGYRTDDGLIKINYSFFKKFIDVNFNEVSVTKRINPSQHGVSAQYTHFFDKGDLIREFTGTVRYFKVQTVEFGEIGKIIEETSSYFAQYSARGAAQGGQKIEAEGNIAMDLTTIDMVRKELADLRLDLAPKVGVTRYDAVGPYKAENVYGAGFLAKLTALLPDKKTKTSIYFDKTTGTMYRYGVEIGRMTESGEFVLFVSRTVSGESTRPTNTIGVKYTIDDPFGLAKLINGDDDETDENSEGKTYPGLFLDKKYERVLTYEMMDIDQGLDGNEYAITPRAKMWRVREIYIDKNSLPNSSKIDKNAEFLLQLDTGVNDLTGTITSVTLNGSAFNSVSTYFGVVGTKYIGVKNFASLPLGTYVIKAPQAGGGSVIMTYTVTHGSVKLDRDVKYAPSVSDALATVMLNTSSQSQSTKDILSFFYRKTSGESNRLDAATAEAMNNGTGDFADGTLLTQLKNGTYTAKVMKGVKDGTFSAAEITQLKAGTLTNTAAESRVDGTGVTGTTITDYSVDESTAVNKDVSGSFTGTGKSYSASGLPSGVTINSSTGVISGTAPSVASNTDYNVTVTCTDTNGLTASKTFKITVLDVGAGAPSSAPTSLALASADDTGVSNSDNITNKTTPQLSWGSVALATSYEISFDGGTTYVNIGNNTTFTAGMYATYSGLGGLAGAALVNGNTYNIKVRAKNGSGTGPETTALAVTVDTAALTDAGNVSISQLTQNQSADFTIGANGGSVYKIVGISTVSGAGTVQVVDGGAQSLPRVLSTPTATPTLRATATNAPGTAFEFNVNVEDQAGNPSTINVYLDVISNVTTPDTPTSLALAAADDTGVSSSDNITKKSTPQLSWSAAGSGGTPTSYEISFDGGTTYVNIGNNTTFIAAMYNTYKGLGGIPAGGTLAEGLVSVKVRAKNGAGTSSAVSSSFTVDQTALGDGSNVEVGTINNGQATDMFITATGGNVYKITGINILTGTGTVEVVEGGTAHSLPYTMATPTSTPKIRTTTNSGPGQSFEFNVNVEDQAGNPSDIYVYLDVNP